MKSAWRILSSLMVFALIGAFVLQPISDPSQVPGVRSANEIDTGDDTLPPLESGEVWVSDPVTPVLSPAVRDLPPYEAEFTLDREINPRLNLNGKVDPNFRSEGGLDPLLVVQANAPQGNVRAFDTPIVNIDGQGYTGVNPPDTVGDVGLDHYIQMINSTEVAIYDKTNANLITQFSLTSLGGCATGSGDPIVLYDRMADRWMLSEFGSGNSLCVFISQTPDPTGAYYSYQFTTPSFPDYPKYGVWPDAYYVTSNESSPAVYALDRTQMLAGATATAQRFSASSLAGFGFQAMTPSDLDGATPPPAGSPNYVMRHRDDEVHNAGSNDPTEDYLEIWEFHVDWVTPANSTFTQVANVPVTEFDSDLCGLTSFYCFPQPGSSTTLDPLREVIMFRLAYRNFGSHEALVGNFVTDVDGTDHGGIRWFELRKAGANPWSLYQEGTFAPDANHRWMGAIAMDGSGNIAVGYNVSHASTTYPSLRYVGRLASDPLGTMPQGEYALVAGSSPNGSNRYGDYSAMSVDPADDCTFWFTGEYNASSTWSTRIGAFKFDTCSGSLGPDFSLSAMPESQVVCTPDDAVYDLELSYMAGFSNPITLSAVGVPTGYSATIVPNPIMTPTVDSVLTLTHTSGAIYGSYSIDIVGVSVPTPTHTTTVGLDVYTAAPAQVSLTSPTNGAVNVDPQVTFEWGAVAQAGEYTIEIATDSGFSNIIDSAVVAGTSYTPGSALPTSALLYWRVSAANPCGAGTVSAVWSFTTEAAPGDCGPGTMPNVLYSEDFESGAPSWTSGGTGNTWALSTSRPYGGSYAYYAQDVSSVSNQQLTSPGVSLPSGSGQALTLQYWNWQEIEDSSGGCFDGGILEISTDGGSTWTQMETELQTDLYDGVISSSYSNPLAGLNAWCGDPADWTESVIDLDAYAGQTVQFRYRLGTDSSAGREGWYLDDLVVQSCVPASYNFSFGPDSSEMTAPNTSVTHEFILSNLGMADSYTLTVSGGSWNTTLLTGSPLAVGAGGSETVQVEVEVPDLEGQDVFTITAQSVASPTLVMTATGTTTAEIDPSVDLTSGSSAQTGLPGELVTHSYTLTNTGNYTDSFSLDVAGNAWPTVVTGNTGNLGPGDAYQVEVAVTIPDNPAMRVIIASDSFTLTATSDFDGGVSAQALGETYANVDAGVQISPASQMGSGLPGAVVKYTYEITNTDNYTDSFSLSLNGNAWETTAPGSTGELAPGEGQSIEVEVIVGQSLPPLMDDFTLTAVSGLDVDVSASATGETQAEVSPDVELNPETARQTGLPGAVVTYTYEITNTGDYTDSFALAINSTWTATLSAASTGELGVGEGYTVTLEVVIPLDAVGGESDLATLTVTSGLDAAISASATAETTVAITEFKIYLPLTER